MYKALTYTERKGTDHYQKNASDGMMAFAAATTATDWCGFRRRGICHDDDIDSICEFDIVLNKMETLYVERQYISERNI